MICNVRSSIVLTDVNWKYTSVTRAGNLHGWQPATNLISLYDRRTNYETFKKMPKGIFTEIYTLELLTKYN